MDNQTPEELEAIAKQEAEAKEIEAKQQAETEKAKLLEQSKEDIYSELQKTRSEAKERRLKEKELSEKLLEYEKKEALEKEKELKAKGKFEDILTEYKTKLEKVEPLANEYMEYLTAKKEVIKKSLEEKGLWVESFNGLKLSELEGIDNKFKENSSKVSTDSSNSFVNKNGKDTREPWEKMMG
jgi:DNA repair exonuclease SbcCD ATPase subunit